MQFSCIQERSTFLHLPTLVAQHHSGAGAGEGGVMFLAPGKTTAGQDQITRMAGVTKDFNFF